MGHVVVYFVQLQRFYRQAPPASGCQVPIRAENKRTRWETNLDVRHRSIQALFYSSKSRGTILGIYPRSEDRVILKPWFTCPTKVNAGSGNMLSDHEAENLRKYSATLANHAVQIFLTEARSDAQPCGTGTLVHSERHLYIITAAHVIDPKYRPGDRFVYEADRTPYQLYGRPILTSKMPSSGNRHDDIVDVAVIKLQGIAPSSEMFRRSIPRSYLIPHALPRQRKNYITVGFQESKTTVFWKEQRIESEVSTNIMGSFRADVYQRLNLPETHHIIFDYRNKQLYSEHGKWRPKQDMRNLKGLSGSPVWVMHDEGRSNDCHIPFLVGILTGHRQNKLCATDIAIPLHYIAQLENS